MHEVHEDFAANYAAMAEPELMDIARSYESLTDPAQTALRAEFARRHLEPPLIEDPEDSLKPRGLVTIRSYRDLSEAIVARSLLESAGIPVMLLNENLIRLDWPLSNLVGGIRLQVDPENESAAMELLTQPMPESASAAHGEDSGD